MTPDILISPSKLTAIVKKVENTLLINPGLTCRGHSGGSIAEITIHPLKREVIETEIEKGNQTMTNLIPDRTSVFIQKL